jgi:RNA polymerase sigma factor (sigma-70 family)
MEPGSQPPTDPTLELLERWRAGDRAALDRLVAEVLPWLQSEVRFVLGNDHSGIHDSLDVVHTTALNFLTWGPRFVPKSVAQLKALLRRIATNEVIDQRRRRSRGGPHLESMLAASASFSGFGPAVASAAQPSRVAERNEDSNWVRLALQFLDEEERQLLLASEVERQDWATIARELGLANADAARMRCARLKPRLANLVRRLRNGEVPQDS